MSFTADEIIAAFTGLGCTTAERAGPNGYVRVWGPTAGSGDTGQCWIIVERHNGALMLREPLATLLEAEARPVPTPRIQDHPLGRSSGQQLGLYLAGLRPNVLERRYATAAELARAVEAAARSPVVIW